MEGDSYQDSIVFEVELEKPPGKRLGIDVSMVPAANGGSLIVENVNPVGAVQIWNSTQQSPFVIQQGDSIIRVNGADESDIAAMAAALGEQGTLRITFRRDAVKRKANDVPSVPDHNMGKGNWNRTPEAVMGSHDDGSYIVGPNGKRMFKYEAFMFKPKGMKFGFHAMPSAEPRGLLVKDISKEGFVELWNKTQPDMYKIRPGYCITEVNGFTCRRMIDELQSASELRLAILRPELKNTQATGQRAQEQGALPPRSSFECPSGLGEEDSTGPGNRGDAGLPLNRPGTVGGIGGFGGPCACGGTSVASGVGGVGGGCCPGSGGCCAGKGVRGGWGASPPSNMLEMGGLPQPDRNFPGAFSNMNEEPLIFYVEIDKPPGARFGINVLPVAGGLLVERVSLDGCVAMWNARNRPPTQVQEGDLITEVNGVKGEQHLSYMAMQLGGPAPGTTKFVVQRENPTRGGGASWPSGANQYVNNSHWNNLDSGYNRQPSSGMPLQFADNYGDSCAGGRCGGPDVPLGQPYAYPFPQHRGGDMSAWSPDQMSTVSQPNAQWAHAGQYPMQQCHSSQGQRDHNMMAGSSMSFHANASPPVVFGNLPQQAFGNGGFGDYSSCAPSREAFMQENAGESFCVDGSLVLSGPHAAEVAARARRLLATRGCQTQPGGDTGDPDILFRRLDMLSDEAVGRLLRNALKSRSPALQKTISDALQFLPMTPVDNC